MGKKSKNLKLPDGLRRKIKGVTAKRPRTVLAHILKHGYVTTEELQDLYGYEHPPRAARDVREHGIPLETYRVRDKKGRNIAAYRLDLDSAWGKNKRGGRHAFSKEFKKTLLRLYGSRCASCGTLFDPRDLQIDHRVPYEVAGEAARERSEDFMLLCPSCNRTKSWTCEHCVNWREQKRASMCKSCYWGNPDKHTHVALVEIRRVELAWMGREVQAFDRLRLISHSRRISMQQVIKEILGAYLSSK